MTRQQPMLRSRCTTHAMIAEPTSICLSLADAWLYGTAYSATTDGPQPVKPMAANSPAISARCLRIIF